MDQTVQANKQEREEKPVAELERGTWIEVIGQDGDYLGEARVLHVETYEEQTLGRRAVLVYQIPGWNPETLRCDAEMTMPLLTGDEVKEREASAERAQRIADVRKLLDFLEANPELPVPRFYFQESPDPHGDVWNSGAEGLAIVTRWAEVMGAKIEALAERHSASRQFGTADYCVIAWHKDGRPAEPAPGSVADPTGLAYSRADEVDDPTPVSPARVPLHTGAMTDEGLVDEGEPELMPSGLTKAADESRGVLAGTTPVVTYFSFGHGQSDPDSGHYVTVVAPTYEACREAMFASRYGREWGMDYLAGTARATEWIPRWTEHEVIVAPGTDETLAEMALKAARRVLIPAEVSGSPCPACGHPEGQHVEDGDVCEVCGCDRR